jgi:inosose dehydratase
MSRIRVANAPCSWGVLEFDLEGVASGGERVLSEMAATGFVGTELGDWGFLPTDPPALKTMLDRHGLGMVGAFVPVALRDPTTHEAGAEAAVKVARLLAAVAETPFIVLADDNGKVPERTANAGRIVPAQGLTDAEWTVFGAGANRVAAAVRKETGLRTVFHHHCAGFVETPAEVATFLDRTDPDLVGLCLDMGHYAFGGGDPLEALVRHGDRIRHIHFKDCDPTVAAQSRAEGWDYFTSVGKGVFCELGKGRVDFPAILKTLQQRGFDGWIVVEQDVLPGMGTPLESARRNREYLARIGL